MKYIACECGRTWRATTKDSAKVMKSRCRKQHVLNDADLTLEKTPMCMANTLCVILSHGGNASQHGRTKTAALKMGIGHVKVVCGKKYDKHLHGTRPLAKKEIVHWNFRHIVVPAVKAYIHKHKVAAVLYLEADAAVKYVEFPEIVAHAKSLNSSSFSCGWLGFRCIHEKGSKSARKLGVSRAVEGSQALLFLNDGVAQVSAASRQKRYMHFDNLLSKHVRYLLPPESIIGTRKSKRGMHEQKECQRGVKVKN